MSGQRPVYIRIRVFQSEAEKSDKNKIIFFLQSIQYMVEYYDTIIYVQNALWNNWF